MKLTRQLVKRKTLPPLIPNAGVRIAYQKRLAKLVEKMHRSVLYHLAAAYKQRESEITNDASPAVFLGETMRKLASVWLKRFADVSKDIAISFTGKTLSLVDGTMQKHLVDIGMAVPFTYTKQMNTVMQACIGDQVGLIKSIPEKYLRDVEGMVMRTIAGGGDLKTLSDELQVKYALTRKRAVLIATDQHKKAHASIEKARQEGLGITKAIWMHSHGGRHPRPEHVKFDGHEYDVKEGAFLEGKWVWPGTEINCRCLSKAILPWQMK